MHAGIVACVIFISLAAVATCDDHGENARDYMKETFDADNAQGKLFVMFFAPWCGHCKRLAPTWDELAKEYNVEGKQVTIGKVDCTIETLLCAEHGVRGYPTVKFFNQKDKEGTKYSGKRSIEDLRSYVEEQMASGAEKAEEKVEAKKEVAAPVANNGLYQLTDNNFADHVAKGHHFVKFYAPWCGHCKRLAPIWDELAADMKSSDQVKIAKVDCTEQPQTCSKFGVRGYPSLIWFTNGEKNEEYKSQRSLDEFKKFVERLSSTKTQPAKLSKDGKVPDILLDDAETGVIALTDEDFVETVGEDFTFVSYANDDQEGLLRTFQMLADEFVDQPEMLVATVNCKENKETCDAQTYDADGNQFKLPHLKLYYDGAVIDTWTKDITVVAMAKFINSNIEKYGDDDGLHDEL